MKLRLVLSMLAFVAGCGSSQPTVPAATPAKETAAAPAIAPRPFTPEQIRDAMPAGHQLRLRMEVAGKPTTIEQWVVTAADATSMTMATKAFDENGKLVEDQGSETTTWAKLMEHATFPAAKTTMTEGEVEVPAGKFAAIIYEVRDEKDGVKVVTRFHFAKQLPGPPVLFTMDAGDKRIRTMTLLERK